MPGSRSWPISINLNHTTICNLRCIMCQQALEDIPQQVMDLGVYRRIRDELFEHISEVALTVMGDPFCVPKPFLNEILDDIERYDLQLEITTNATLFGNDEQLDRLARLTSRMIISIDGGTKETFEHVRVKANWERTVRNIERFNEARLRLPIHRRPLVYFNYVLMKSTLDEFPRFVELAKRWGGYQVNGLALILVDPAIASEAISLEDPHVLDILSQARETALRVGIRFVPDVWVGIPPARNLRHKLQRGVSKVRARLEAYRPVMRLGPAFLARMYLHRLKLADRECPFLWAKPYLLINGEVSTCCHPDFLEMGDLTKMSFRDIWNGRRYQALRETLNTDHPAKPCKDCHLLRFPARSSKR